MTITNQTARVRYAGAGITGPFPIGMDYADAADLQVAKRLASGADLPLTENVDFSVTAGNLFTSAAVAIGEQLAIARVTPATQQADYVPNDDFPAESHEKALDKLTMLIQELRSDMGRALRFPITDPIGLDVELPTSDQRLGKFLAFGPDGTPVVASGTGNDAALRVDLAQGISGAGLVALNHSVNYPSSSIGAALNQFPSVKNQPYGAKGDDLTDDTAAFVAAAATGKIIIIPPGTYRVAGVTFNARVIFMPGAKIRRTGGNLYFSGGITAPVEQIFLDAVYPNIDIHNTLTPEGWVDWFGYDANAIETCHKIFRVNRFGPRDYTVTRTVILDQSYREVIGFYGSAEGFGGTRIVLAGAATANQPVIQVGTLNTVSVLSCARRLNIRGINTIRDGVVTPSTTDRRENAVPGWKIAGWYEGQMEDCFDYGSPIHYRIYGTCSCTMRRCRGVRPNGGAANGHPDYYTAFAVGGFATSFGFIGANASLLIEGCSSAGGVGTDRMGVYLFGYIGDTWIGNFEDSATEYGIFVDGADAAGVTLTNPTAHQDVRIERCILDAKQFNCVTVQHINSGGTVTLDNVYGALATTGDGILVNACLGMVSITGGEMIGASALANYGIRIAGSKRVTVAESVKIKDFRVGLRAESSDRIKVKPTITRSFTGGTNAMELLGVGRSIAEPLIDADLVAFDYGIVSDSATNFTEMDISAINPACLTTGSATRKIWHNGAAVAATPFGNNNERVGVVG